MGKGLAACFILACICLWGLCSCSAEKNGTFNEYADFKEGTYSNGSSQSAKTLKITDVTETTFKYQVIAANGTDVITEGTASITDTGKAKCNFKDDYTITFTNSGNNVVELTESEQQLFPSGKITFYTI